MLLFESPCIGLIKTSLKLQILFN